MTPRTLLVAAALVAASGCSESEIVGVQATSHAVTAGAPNVVVIMTDDLDVDGMNTMIELGLAPNIEEYLVRAGAVFTESFVSNSLCCPSRATFLTGQYSHNNGVLTNRGDAEGGVESFVDTSTLGTWMHDAGYRTSYIGKYLNGYGRSPRSLIPAEHPRYVPPGWDHWQGQIGASMYDYRINDTVDGVTSMVRYGEAPEDYKTTVIARRAGDFIRDAEVRDDDQPFFLVVMPKAPHPEPNRAALSRFDHRVRPAPGEATAKPDRMALIASLTPTSFDKPSFDDVDPSQPTWLRTIGEHPLNDTHKAQITDYYHDRLGSMLSVDDLVGTVMEALAETGELDNTVVFFTSDNGYLLGEHRWHQKIVAFDEATRVPLYVRGPGIAPGARGERVINADLAPTIAELARVPTGLAVDGRSLVPILGGQPVPTWRQSLFLEHFLVAAVPDYAGLRTGRYLYVEYFDGSGERELYDLAADPFATVSLHAEPDYQADVATLSQELAEMKQCGDGSCQELEVRTTPGS